MQSIHNFSTRAEDQMGVDNYWGDSAGGIMTVHHVAKYLRLSEAKVYRMARTGELPAFRIGKTWRFDKRSIDDWIREKTELTSLRPIIAPDNQPT
jgi:excisionase family DNA binding protein